MAGRQPLGVIRDISGSFRYDTLALFNDRLVLVRGTVGQMILRSTQMQLGALGALALYPAVKRAQTKQLAMISSHEPTELVRINPKNLMIPYEQIVNAQLKKSFLTGQLTLTLTDGSTQKMKWPKGTNKYEQVAPLLQQALGTKLSEVS